MSPRRPPALHREPFDGKPHDLFFFDLGGRRYVGRKAPFRFVEPQGTREYKGCLVDASMLLGVFERDQLSEHGVAVFYTPLSEADRKACFDELRRRPETDLFYPYPRLSSQGRRESFHGLDEWLPSVERVEDLSFGEREVRRFTLELLAGFAMDGAVLYDPACSTGEFLGTLKQRFPGAYAIGQDQSPEMVDFCRGRLDEVHCSDAATSPVPDGSADFVFCRFLNFHVVTTARAYELFPAVARRAKEDGHVVVFGHTPVLLAAPFFEALGLEVLRRTAASEELGAVYQYYLLRRRGPLLEPPLAWWAEGDAP